MVYRFFASESAELNCSTELLYIKNIKHFSSGVDPYFPGDFSLQFHQCVSQFIKHSQVCLAVDVRFTVTGVVHSSSP